MTRARLGYDFIAVPRKRHPGWIGLKHSSGQFLFAPLFEIAEGAPIPIHGSDWRVWLCRIWCLSGKARSPVCKALDELAERGVIAVGEGFLSVLFRPEDEHKEGAQRPKPSLQKEHSGSEKEHVSPNSGRHSDLSVENNSTLKIQTDRQNRKTERETERAHASGFRRPVGEPPPNFVETFHEPDPEPTLEEQIIKLWRGAVYAKLTKWPGSTKQVATGASEVAAWLRENVRDGSAPLSDFQAALKLYIADDKESLRKNTWPLSWLVERLPGYLAPAAPSAEPKSNNPTHQVWKAPDYEAEMRWSYDPERIRREREVLFGGDQEAIARAEEAEREMLERAAATRVVVSIAEAKPQVKPGYRTKTPEEIAERKRLLEEQVRALKAANAAE